MPDFKVTVKRNRFDSYNIRANSWEDAKRFVEENFDYEKVPGGELLATDSDVTDGNFEETESEVVFVDDAYDAMKTFYEV